MENKKVKNARSNTYNGILFKSQIEKTVYKTLIELGVTPVYEGNTFTLSPAVRPTKVPFFTRRKNRKTHLNDLTLDMSPIDAITYTPDFTFVFNDIYVIIEVKGHVNDVYPVKRNLFRKYIENSEVNILFFEVRSKKEVLKVFNIINTINFKILHYIGLLPFNIRPKCYKFLNDNDFSGLVAFIDSLLKSTSKKSTTATTKVLLQPLYEELNKIIENGNVEEKDTL